MTHSIFYTTQIMSRVDIADDGSISSKIVSQWTRETNAPRRPKPAPRPLKPMVPKKQPKQTITLETQSIKTMDF